MTGECAEFKAIIRSDLLRGIVNTISMLVDEAKFNIDKNGWNIKAVDPAHISVLELEIDSDLFEEYKVTQNGSIGVDIDKLKEKLRFCKDQDVVRIEVKQVNWIIGGENQKVTRLILTDGDIVNRMSLVDTTGMSEPKVPNLSLKNSFSMTWDKMQNVLKRMESISNYVHLCSFKEGIKIYAEGDTDDCVVMFHKDLLVEHKPSRDFECESTNISGRDHDKSMFPLDYISMLFRNSKVNGMKILFHKGQWLEVMKFEMDSDYPVKMTAEKNGLKFKYILAPRITNE